MKEKNLIIGAAVSVFILLIVASLIVAIKPKLAKQKPIDNNEIIEESKEEDTPIVATIERQIEQAEEDPEYVKTPADITQEIQEQDINIGTLQIPRTNYSSEVYCKQNADKMEEMPCMLYTNEGPNKPGVTVLVGHNRENDTLFSNNNQLEENDEFYFTDINGDTKKYVIYSKFVTANDDVSFYNTPSEVPIIAMQCCLTANTSDQVLIVMGKSED